LEVHPAKLRRRGNFRIAFGLARINAGVVVREGRAGASTLGRRLRRGGAAHGAPRTEFDPLDPDVLADPYPGYAQLLEGAPVHYCPRWSVWVIPRHEDVREAARAHDRLSSAESVTRLRARIPMMLTSDRPEHARLRRIVAPAFTHEGLERWRPEVERLARDAVGEMVSTGTTDVVSRLAAPLPVAVIAKVLGIPQSRLPQFREWSDRAVEGFAVEPGPGSLRSSIGVLGATVRLHAFFRRQFEARRDAPGDDVLSRLMTQADEPLTEKELFWFALMLLVAGNETTTNLIGTMLLSLARHPDQYERLRAHPTLIPGAVEEALRHTSPIQGMYRTARVDYAVGQATIPAGGRVLLLFGAANRDPRKYGEPDRFLVDRNPSDHLAFGAGIHFCLGAHLARMEAVAVLEELVPKASALEVAGEPVWRRNPNLRGLDFLPLKLGAA
jgi:beta-dihydromenaquinone-9 omega-hydroxylase